MFSTVSTPLMLFLLLIFKYVNCDMAIGRIFHGTPIRIEDYPYYAGLRNCGAAIISDKWLLTAAHCVSSSHSKKYFVWVGGETFRNSIAVPYDEVIMHPGYDFLHNIPIDDVALIRLAKSLKFSPKIKPIGLPLSGLPTNTSAVFVGRGLDESGKPSSSIMKVELVRLTTEQCIKQMPREFQPFANHNRKLFERVNICARRRENMPSICHGDSGSPLVSGDVLIGLASYIASECSSARLGFYVNIPYYVPWIKSVTGL